MKLFFRPDPFKEKNGQEIELEDIEIEEIYSACNDYMTFSLNEDFSIDIKRLKDIQKNIENFWDYPNKLLPLKRKNNLGRLNKDSGVKLQLDKQGLKDMNKGLKATLEIINEEDIKSPSDRTFKIWKDDKLDKMLEGEKR